MLVKGPSQQCVHSVNLQAMQLRAAASNNLVRRHMPLIIPLLHLALWCTSAVMCTCSCHTSHSHHKTQPPDIAITTSMHTKPGSGASVAQVPHHLATTPPPTKAPSYHTWWHSNSATTPSWPPFCVTESSRWLTTTPCKADMDTLLIVHPLALMCTAGN